MNVLLANPWEPQVPGGVTVVIGNLARGFRERGDRVVLLTPKHDGAPEVVRVEGGSCYRMRMRNPSTSWRRWRSFGVFLALLPLDCWNLARLIVRERIDVVNAHYFHENWLYFVILKRFLKFRLVMSVHGSDVLGSEGRQNMRLMSHWRRWIDLVIYCSDGFRREVLDRVVDALPPSAIVLNGIDDKWPEHPLPVGERLKQIVCVAHLREHKGQDVLIRAVAEIADEFPGLELLLIGEGPFRRQLEGLVEELRLNRVVKVLGQVSRAKTIDIVRQARVSCLPSRREPFGLVLVEAMALGTPIVATRTGGIPEIIRDKIDGLLVTSDSVCELADALRIALRDDDGCSRMVKDAHLRFFKHFRNERFVEEYRQQLAPPASSR